MGFVLGCPEKSPGRAKGQTAAAVLLIAAPAAFKGIKTGLLHRLALGPPDALEQARSDEFGACM